jgi:hypothetical protein
MSGERPEDLAREGLEHLQAAAREVIRATRSLLDAAEELVDDPAAVQSVVGTIASVAQAAAGRLRAEAHPRPRSGPADADDDAPRAGRVQHIRVS